MTSNGDDNNDTTTTNKQVPALAATNVSEDDNNPDNNNDNGDANNKKPFQKLGQGMTKMKSGFEKIGETTKKIFVQHHETTKEDTIVEHHNKSEKTLKEKIQQVFPGKRGNDDNNNNNNADNNETTRDAELTNTLVPKQPTTVTVVATDQDQRQDMMGERQVSDLTSLTMDSERTTRVNNTTTATKTKSSTVVAFAKDTSTKNVADMYATASLQREHSDWLLFHIWWISLAVAAVPTLRHYGEFGSNENEATSATTFPSTTLLWTWMFCAYWTGQVWSLERIVQLTHHAYVCIRGQRDEVECSARSPILERSLRYLAGQMKFEPIPEEEEGMMKGEEAEATAPREERRWNKFARGVRTIFGGGRRQGKTERKNKKRSKRQERDTPRYYSASQVAIERHRSMGVAKKYGVGGAGAAPAGGETGEVSDSMMHLYSEETGERRPSWIDRMDPMRKTGFQNHEDFLMQTLMKNPKLRRRRGEVSQNSVTPLVGTGKDLSVVPEGDDESGAISEATGTVSSKGAVATQQSGDVKSFHDMDDYIIHPVLKVRGMDIFLTENPEFDVVGNPWFKKNGLRDVPGLIFNGVTQWGNVLVYFELPNWVKDLGDSLVIEEGDSPDKRSLKKFLSESDEYKNDRIKMIPSLVDGPMAVKVLAPPKKERLIHGANVPLVWYYHDTEVDPATGQTLHPVVLCTLDCVSGKVIRSMAGIVKKYLVKLTIDLALVIGEPQDPHKRLDHEEPQACLGLFRFENVDVMACPEFPISDESDLMLTEEERDEQLALRLSKLSTSAEEAHDIAVARRLSGISKEDFEKLELEELEETGKRVETTDVVETNQ